MKKIKKMSLANIQDSLSKDEMKRIMAGSGGGSRYCDTTAQCQAWYGWNCGCSNEHNCSCGRANNPNIYYLWLVGKAEFTFMR